MCEQIEHRRLEQRGLVYEQIEHRREEQRGLVCEQIRTQKGRTERICVCEEITQTDGQNREDFNRQNF